MMYVRYKINYCTDVHPHNEQTPLRLTAVFLPLLSVQSRAISFYFPALSQLHDGAAGDSCLGVLRYLWLGYSVLWPGFGSGEYF